METHILRDLPPSCAAVFTHIRIEPDFLDSSRLHVVFFEPDAWGGEIRTYGCSMHRNRGRWTFPLSGSRKMVRDYLFTKMTREAFRDLQRYVTAHGHSLYP